MERFPASWVHTPTAFTSPEPAELYNNVLAFVVGPPGPAGAAGAGPGAAPPVPPAPDAPRRELHIFQCHDVGAQTLVEELNALKSVYETTIKITINLKPNSVINNYKILGNT